MHPEQVLKWLNGRIFPIYAKLIGVRVGRRESFPIFKIGRLVKLFKLL